MTLTRQPTSDSFLLTDRQVRITPPDDATTEIANGGISDVLYVQDAIFSLSRAKTIAAGKAKTFTAPVWIASDDSRGANVTITSTPVDEER